MENILWKQSDRQVHSLHSYVRIYTQGFFFIYLDEFEDVKAMMIVDEDEDDILLCREE